MAANLDCPRGFENPNRIFMSGYERPLAVKPSPFSRPRVVPEPGARKMQMAMKFMAHGFNFFAGQPQHGSVTDGACAANKFCRAHDGLGGDLGQKCFNGHLKRFTDE